MPSSHRRRLIGTLRRRLPGLPVVVVTGYGPESPAADLRGLGGPTARLHKPCSPDQLVAAVRQVLAPARDPSGRS